MNLIANLNENIYAVTTPYKDIFTTTLVIKTDTGAMLFDSASFDHDINDTILPMLDELKISKEELKCVFISHNHNDHAGGLRELLHRFPDISVYSNSPTITDRCDGGDIRTFSDGEEIMPNLVAIKIPGHTADSAAILDKRTGSLITGDCLQLYGIFGSGTWGSNINYPREHFDALKKLKGMSEILNIYTAHDYHPYGRSYEGREAVNAAISACERPLLEVKRLIEENPTLSDSEIADLYNSEALPTLGAHVVKAMREKFL